LARIKDFKGFLTSFFMKLKVLVMGFGSIGKRHTENLIKLGIKPYVLTKYPNEDDSVIFLSNLSSLKTIDFAIIATHTAKHYNDFKRLIDSCDCSNILIEKPIEKTKEKGLKIKAIALEKGINIYVAYNLRFFKFFELLSHIIEEQLLDIRLVKIFAGSYLPEWRPHQDYRKSYSSNKDLGGGVNLDLSHEIDYMLWLFNRPSSILFRWLGNLSSLDINSPDYFKVIYQYNHFLVDLELDYFTKMRRGIQILGENKIIVEISFYPPRIILNDKAIDPVGFFNWDESYKEELKEFLRLVPISKLCTLDEAINIFDYI
jgi:predicted dehydrogenase